MRLFLCMLFVAAFISVTSAQAATPCVDFSARLPNVKRATCEAAKLQPGAGHSVKGRPIFIRDIHPQDARLRVLVIGGIHGDELSSASLALNWLGLAQSEPAQTYWRFIPALNPDGLLSQPARRVNANGVDLNRNFPTPHWTREAAAYWEKRTGKDPRRWPGKNPLSEPESKFLVEEIQRFKPHLIVSIHAPYGILDFDGSIQPPSRLGGLLLDQLGIFPGSLGNYGGVNHGTPVVTIELPNALKTPTDVEMLRMWRDLRQWMDMTLGHSLVAQGTPAVLP